jgi:hypothetical protein
VKDEAKAFGGLGTQSGPASAGKVNASNAAGILSFANITFASVTALIYRLANATLELGKNADSARESFRAGGSRREANMPDREATALSRGLTPLIKDSAAGMWNSAAGFMAKAMAGLGSLVVLMTQGKEAQDEYNKGVAESVRLGEEESKIRDAISENEDGLADLANRQTNTEQQQLSILKKQLEIEEQKMALANLETVQGREMFNQASAKSGEIRKQVAGMMLARSIAEDSADFETQQIYLKQTGYERIAQLAKMSRDYELKILEAKRLGQDKDLITKDENGRVVVTPSIVSNLQAQREMADLGVSVAEHNMSTRERLSERSRARKFARDSAKTFAQEDEMKRRLKTLGLGDDFGELELDAAERAGKITRGSKMDRFARAQIARKMANPKVSQMTVEKITTQAITANSITIANK